MPEISFNLIALIIGIPLILWFTFERGMALMKFFQQEEYDGVRFIAWVKDIKAYDRRASLWLLAAALVGTLSQTLLSGSVGNVLAGAKYLTWPLMTLAFIHGAFRSRAMRKTSKKPLVMTARAKRIFMVYMALSAATLFFILVAGGLAPKGEQYAVQVDMSGFSWLTLQYDWRVVTVALLLIAFVQALPALLVFGNKFLEPAEERVKARFRAEAVEKFNKLQPRVIAITGSFGKTSTKHILQHILSTAAPTLATPGSVNTDMGITRVIREQLTPEHDYFIVEMGAYGPGSIARLCTLTPPDVGMITAVGAAHYERFKSLETVARAKFELAEATFKKDGEVVVSTDGIPPELLAERMKAVPGRYISAGRTGDIALKDSTMTRDGLTLKVMDGTEEHILKAPLYGRHQAGNIVLAAAAARAIGLPWAAIKGALASMPQIRHRLEVSLGTDGPTLINDAYNSNPVGFAAALECLDVLVTDGGRRILVTPGMVELGEKHEEEHAALGALAAKHADIVLVVTPDRIPSFVSALNAANDGSTTVMTFAKQEEAEAWVKANWRAGDAVLFENNLPDLYESRVSF
ncbi:Mur ligase family protein [Kordiimonas marina]|uniref:Mur ligase family protein n=1 Tax=Kordiimonas marina TaxID=2872312 RepID=UPI001FF44B75|nr:UDP-N-acetylmuramoyl-tripeptide--D-alanyl-D-alanine ligase [Kordiimonas marina]MCJ9429911.1 UDP-N-acetylmuramoyl-tripeptide--D-alanyl-D-alanine ligase [Kordiimonas marina]